MHLCCLVYASVLSYEASVLSLFVLHSSFVWLTRVCACVCVCGGEGVVLRITKTYLYDFYLLKPHFYIVKLGFTGIYIIFLLFVLKNIDCGYSLEPPW